MRAIRSQVQTFAFSFLDAASSSGVFAGTGVTWVMTRTAAGVYRMNFDPAILPLVVLAQPVAGGTYIVNTQWVAMGPGNFTINVWTPAAAASNVAALAGQMTAKDMRP